MTDILQAARSYYGLVDTESCTTQLFTNQSGQACVAFEIALSNEDFAAIVQRMQNMQQPDTQPDTAIIEGPTVEAMREAYNALSKAEKGRYGSFARYMAESSAGMVDTECRVPRQYTVCDENGPTDKKTEVDVSRQAWDALDDRTRGSYGSYESYYQALTVPAIKAGTERQVVHVDAPEEPEPVSMDAVWIDASEATQAQAQHKSDVCYETGRYLIQWAMLTDEQKQKAKEAKP